MVKQERHRFVDHACAEDMIIIQHQHAGLRERGQLVQRHREQGCKRRLGDWSKANVERPTPGATVWIAAMR